MRIRILETSPNLTITYMVALAMSLDPSLHKQGSQGDQAALGGFESLSQYSSLSGVFSQPFSDFLSLVPIGENRLSHPRLPCRTRNDMKIPT